MLSVPCCFILPIYRTCRSIKEADEVPADDGVADIEQDACDAFLTRAEPCGGCDVLLREGVALFRGFQCGNLTARFWPIDIRRLAPLSQSCTCRFSFSRTIACQGNDKLRSPWPRLRMAQRSEALNRIGGSPHVPVHRAFFCITVVPAASRSSQHRWIWTRNPIASRPRSLTQKNI
jgi:hypothetical protein